MNIVSIGKKLYQGISDIHLRNYQNKCARESLTSYNKPLGITREEKNEIKRLWGQCGFVGNTDWHRLYKNANKYDPRYVPTDLYGTEIIPRLNKNNMIPAWDDKSFYSRFFPNITSPKSIAYRIDGSFYNEEYATEDVEKVAKKSLKEKPLL